MSLTIRKEVGDVLVVGGGGAGLRAAIAAKEQLPEGRVILATKGKLGRSGVTALACSDRMAFHATLSHTEPGGSDSYIYHAEDVFEIGGRVSDAHLAAILARHSEEAFNYLDQLGVPFVYKDGIPHQFVTDGSEYARACYTGPYTAVHIEEQLVKEFHNYDILLFEECAIVHLLTGPNGITGALALEKKGEDEELVVISAPSVIITTGGGGLIYADNVFPPGNTGDGCMAAYQAGAELVNMEFIQIGIASVTTKLNCSGSMMRAIPRFVNDTGEEILPKYFPPGTGMPEIYDTVFRKGATWPLTYEHITHILDIAVYKEQQKGRKVYMDYASNPEGFAFSAMDQKLHQVYRDEMKHDLGESARHSSPLARLKEINPESVQWLKDRGIDLERGAQVEIATCAQHFQGGIKINSRGESAVPGLFAAGECAGGQHGANRPGGNALLDGQIFGKITGSEAAKRAQQEPLSQISNHQVDDLLSRLTSFEDAGLPVEELRQHLQQLMTKYCSVVRTREGLEQGLAELQELRKQPIKRGEASLSFALETRAMLTFAEAVLLPALQRDESRGPHLRFARSSDNQPLPRKDPDWRRYIVLRRSTEGMKLEVREPVRDFQYKD